ncbi:type II toxin-antitoxin system Phd/YefM family antitoxin [Scytonema tolypothrichoides VB-61278]|nr:type II toxin-antitoxin system Phd/YefM family antitoxin [Scytonema tolypothrichoides VB-61278]
MPEEYSIAEARNHFARIIHNAENGKPIQITRRGKPVAVVLSVDEYQRLTSERLEFGTGLMQFRQKYEIEVLDIHPDQVFNDVRDRTGGREIIF